MDPFLQFLVSGKDPSHVNFHPEFAPDLLEFLLAGRAAGHNIGIQSGYRSPEHQGNLWQRALKKYGSASAARKWVAPPPGVAGGKGSRHNFGLAGDLHYPNAAARKWAHDNAAAHNLVFRMGHEPWHIEPIGAAAFMGGQHMDDRTTTSAHNLAPGSFREFMAMKPRERGPAIMQLMKNGLMMGSTPLQIDPSSSVLPSVQGEQALLARGQPFDKAAVYGSMLSGSQPTSSNQPMPRPRSTGLAMQGPQSRPQFAGPRSRPMMMDAHIQQLGGLGQPRVPRARPGIGGFLAGLLGL